MAKKFTALGFGLAVLLAMPSVAKWLESSMVGQMLVQIPALIIGGYLIGRGIDSSYTSKLKNLNTGGFPGLLLAIFIISFWLLPRSLDAALTKPFMELANNLRHSVMLAGFKQPR